MLSIILHKLNFTANNAQTNLFFHKINIVRKIEATVVSFYRLLRITMNVTKVEMAFHFQLKLF